MVFVPRYLIDTNILLRATRLQDPAHPMIRASLGELERQKTEMCFALQNIVEFWNVCTRPVDRNGFGLSIAETNESVEYIERTMTFLPDNNQVYSIWRQLAATHSVRGVQVHDARLVATMLAHDVTHLLTLNQPDFARYGSIQAVHPSQLQTSAP